MTTHEFDNRSDQAERRKVLKDTLFARQQNTADDAGGRFTKLTPSTLTGQSQQVSPLPPSSPWSSGFDQNVEPELGFSVDEMPAVGTPVEVEKSVQSDNSDRSSSSIATPPIEQGDDGLSAFSSEEANEK